ncbi:Uncharacterised protein [Sphingomonas paucimobilis]|nr:Uncharacterised protein [Sphingomonas paucimobilis]
MAGYGRCLGPAVDEVAVPTIGLVAAAQDTSTATHGYSAVPARGVGRGSEGPAALGDAGNLKGGVAFDFAQAEPVFVWARLPNRRSA